MSENADWVSAVLGSQPDPVLPEAVATRIEAALAEEVTRRSDGVAADENCRAVNELHQRSSQGSFGTNAPSHFDRPGLGIIDAEHAQ